MTHINVQCGGCSVLLVRVRVLCLIIVKTNNKQQHEGRLNKNSCINNLT